jgi:hypothetical protein
MPVNSSELDEGNVKSIEKTNEMINPTKRKLNARVNSWIGTTEVKKFRREFLGDGKFFAVGNV